MFQQDVCTGAMEILVRDNQHLNELATIAVFEEEVCESGLECGLIGRILGHVGCLVLDRAGGILGLQRIWRHRQYCDALGD